MEWIHLSSFSSIQIALEGRMKEIVSLNFAIPDKN